MGFSLLGAIDFGAVAWEFICKMFFWITKTLAWLLDFFQLLFRKLVGLDTYYYNGVQVNPGENAVSGDIIEMLIKTDVIRNLFISLLILGFILLFIVTFVAVWKTEWDFGKDGNSKTKIFNSALKALFNFIAVPVVAMFGIFVGNALLRAIDGATGGYSQNGLSQMVFNTLAVDAVRSDHYSSSLNKAIIDANLKKNDGKEGIFLYFADSQNDVSKEDIVEAFNNNHKLTDKKYQIFNVQYDFFGEKDYLDLDSLNEDLANGELVFSWDNEELVNVFFDFSKMNYIVVLLLLIIMIKTMLGMTFTLAQRLFTVTILFVISPPIVAMTPINDKGFSSWKGEVIKQITVGYVTIAIYNIFLSIYPIFTKISLFSGTGIENFIVGLLLVCVGLLSIEGITSMIQGSIGKNLGLGELKSDGGEGWKKTFAMAGKGLNTTAKVLGAPIGVPLKTVGKAVQYGNIARYQGFGSMLKQAGKDFKGSVIDKTPISSMTNEIDFLLGKKDDKGNYKTGGILSPFVVNSENRKKLGVNEVKGAVKETRSSVNSDLKNLSTELKQYGYEGKNDSISEKIKNAPHAEKRNKYFSVKTRFDVLNNIPKENLTTEQSEELKKLKKSMIAYKNFHKDNTNQFETENEFIDAYSDKQKINKMGKLGTVTQLVKDKNKLKVSKANKNAIKDVKEVVAKRTAKEDAEKDS